MRYVINSLFCNLQLLGCFNDRLSGKPTYFREQVIMPHGNLCEHDTHMFLKVGRGRPEAWGLGNLD